MVLLGGGLAFAFLGGGAVMELNDIRAPMHIARFGILLLVAGVGVLIGTIVMGLRRTSDRSYRAEPIRVPGLRVLSRFAITPVGETVFNQDYVDMEDPKTQLLVQVRYPGGRLEELRCAPDVWTQCGEGMVGDGIVQGKWLGGFAVHIGERPA